MLYIMIMSASMAIGRPISRAADHPRQRREDRMFKWTYTETVPTKASADQVWAVWQDAVTWPQWDSELQWVRLDGAFEVGTKGRMKPTAGPEVDFVLTEVQPNARFADKARLPLTDIVFDHVYLPGSDGQPATIRHSVSMVGVLAPLFGKVIGSRVKTHLRDAMLDLARRAEKGSHDHVARPAA